MSVNILTKEDLQQFKIELLEEIKLLISLHQNLTAKRWLRSSELKKHLGLSPGTLQTLRINGTLTFTKLGGIIYYDYDHIEKVFQINLQAATKPFPKA